MSSTQWREEGRNSPSCSNPDIRQKRRSEVDSSVFYLLWTTGIEKQWVRWVTEGCVRHLVRESGILARGWWTQGRQEAPPARSREDTAGRTRGECYTDVVTRSVAWLTSFLLESSPLAAFMSFRKFSAVFFMFFNSPGCGVARLCRVLCKQTEARVSEHEHSNT